MGDRRFTRSSKEATDERVTRPRADDDLTQALYVCEGYWEAKDDKISY